MRAIFAGGAVPRMKPSPRHSIHRLTGIAALAVCAILTGCASSSGIKAPSDEGSYTLGEKKDSEDPLSLHGQMEVSVGYDSGNFPDARRAMGGPARW
jgi:hypothetical protein